MLLRLTPVCVLKPTDNAHVQRVHLAKIAPSIFMEEPSASTAAQPTAAEPRCGCGHAKDNFWVSANARYSAWGFIMGVFMGISGTLPKSIQFQCRKCGQVIEERRDQKSIMAFREH